MVIAELLGLQKLIEIRLHQILNYISEKRQAIPLSTRKGEGREAVKESNFLQRIQKAASSEVVK